MIPNPEPRTPNPEHLANFEKLRKRISVLAKEHGVSENESICRILSIGLREFEKVEGVQAPNEIGELSARQRAVLEALRNGSAVKEIADDLKISEVTVRTHIQRIRARLGYSDLLRLRIP